MGKFSKNKILFPAGSKWHISCPLGTCALYWEEPLHVFSMCPLDLKDKERIRNRNWAETNMIVLYRIHIIVRSDAVCLRCVGLMFRLPFIPLWWPDFIYSWSEICVSLFIFAKKTDNNRWCGTTYGLIENTCNLNNMWQDCIVSDCIYVFFSFKHKTSCILKSSCYNFPSSYPYKSIESTHFVPPWIGLHKKC